MKQSIGLRIAIRSDTDTIKAFLCSTEQSPESGTLLSTLSKNVALSDGGRHGKIFTDWMTMLNQWLERTLVKLDVTGTEIETVEPGLDFTTDKN